MLSLRLLLSLALSLDAEPSAMPLGLRTLLLEYVTNVRENYVAVKAIVDRKERKKLSILNSYRHFKTILLRLRS